MARWVENSLPVDGRRNTDHAERERIAVMYRDEEKSIAAIKRATGHTVTTIQKILRDQGVELRPHAARGKPFGAMRRGSSK